MYSSSRLFIVSAATLALLAACTTGGFTAPVGVQCAAGYNPFPMTGIPDNQKVSLKPSGSLTDNHMPPGTYTYASSSLFYSEQQTPSNPNPLQIRVQDLASTTAGGAPSDSISCVHNAKLGMGGIAVQAFFPNSITVNEDFTQQVIVGSISLNINNGVIQTVAPPPGKDDTPITDASTVPMPSPTVGKVAVPTPGQEAYPNPVLLKNSDVDYEYRAAFQDPNGKYTYTISVQLTYVAPPPTAPGP